MNFMMAMHDRCQGDVQGICSAVPQSPNANAACLVASKPELTSGCREVTEKFLLVMQGLAPAPSEPSATGQADSAQAAAPSAACLR